MQRGALKESLEPGISCGWCHGPIAAHSHTRDGSMHMHSNDSIIISSKRKKKKDSSFYFAGQKLFVSPPTSFMSATPKRISPFSQAWYKWKALRLPWRKRFLIGKL
jgi:hypothetical protein